MQSQSSHPANADAMSVPRRDYLRMAQIDVQLFKTLQRRNQLPTCPPPTGGKSIGGQGYHPLEAILMAVADKLAMDCSFSRSLSADVISQNWNLITAVVLEIEEGNLDQGWISFMAGDDTSCRTVIVGRADEVFGKVAAHIALSPDMHCVAAINIAPLVQHALTYRHRTGGGSRFSASATDV